LSKSDLSVEEIRQREYYNSISENYNDYYASSPALRYRYDIYNRILTGLDLTDFCVLEAMCGGGQITDFFIKRGATVFAQDISEEQLTHYRTRFPNADIRCESILKMSYQDNTFNLVSVDSLHHVKKDINKAMDEILRVLKPGGYILIWEPASNSILDRLRRIWYRTDPKYFTNDESAIDIETMIKDYHGRIEPQRIQYGGNFAYFFVHSAMLFRIPHGLVEFYAPAMAALEKGMDRLTISQRMPAWVLALFKKNS
jgi:SAM-dependent methyltransferase